MRHSEMFGISLSSGQANRSFDDCKLVWCLEEKKARWHHICISNVLVGAPNHGSSA